MENQGFCLENLGYPQYPKTEMWMETDSHPQMDVNHHWSSRDLLFHLFGDDYIIRCGNWDEVRDVENQDVENQGLSLENLG